MPRKPKEEKEEELDVSTSKKKVTFATQWFEDNAVNNKEDMKIICDLTARSAEEQLCIFLKSRNNEVFAVIFYATFMTILDWLRGRQGKKKNFTIEIANSINIGYVNNDSEENEKVGNFMPIMEHIGINRNIIDDGIDNINKTSANSIRWKELNIKESIEKYDEIQNEAYNRLKKDYRIDVRTPECVIPLFCMFLDHITNYMKLKFQEVDGTDVSEVQMNVLGLFDVFYSFNPDDNVEVLEYVPNIKMKLALKNDENANIE